MHKPSLNYLQKTSPLCFFLSHFRELAHQDRGGELKLAAAMTTVFNTEMAEFPQQLPRLLRKHQHARDRDRLRAL